MRAWTRLIAFSTMLLYPGLTMGQSDCVREDFSIPVSMVTDGPCRVLVKPNPLGEDGMNLYSFSGAAYQGSRYIENMQHFGQPKLDLLGEGSEWVLMSKNVPVPDGILSASKSFPLLFRVLPEKGLVYIGGKGEAKFENGFTRKLGENATLERAFKCINSKYELDRLAAIWALGWLPNTTQQKLDAINALSSALRAESRKNRFARIVAAEALGRIGNYSAVTVLEEFTGDRDWWFRDVVSESIQKIRERITALETYQAQRRLQELGYSPGVLDGVVGIETRKAIERFQKDQSISITGKLDNKTKEKLQIKREF